VAVSAVLDMYQLDALAYLFNAIFEHNGRDLSLCSPLILQLSCSGALGLRVWTSGMFSNIDVTGRRRADFSHPAVQGIQFPGCAASSGLQCLIISLTAESSFKPAAARLNTAEMGSSE
jgi:hypothetical protein